jgi:hypothetical protein
MTTALTYNNLTRRIYNNYWKEDRISALYPRIGSTGDAGAFTSMIVEDGSFLRCSSLTLGYTHNLKKPGFISAIGITLTGRNLFVLTNYSGYDPEVTSFANDPLRVGVDFASYPKNRSFSMGLTFDF